jgi:hypothetical protein
MHAPGVVYLMKRSELRFPLPRPQAAMPSNAERRSAISSARRSALVRRCWAVPCLAVGGCVPLAAPPQNRPDGPRLPLAGGACRPAACGLSVGLPVNGPNPVLSI